MGTRGDLEPAISSTSGMIATGIRSLALIDKLPLVQRLTQIGDPTLADRLLYRLVRRAQWIEMQGESERRKRSGRKRAAASPRAEKH